MMRTGRITETFYPLPPHTLGVLLVDSDQDHLALWGSLLSYVGYRVFCARSAFEATLYFSYDPQCVVISDRVPDFDALDYVRRLAVPGLREFVLLTEELTPSLAERVKVAGAGAALARTAASLQELVDAIEHACADVLHAGPVHVAPTTQQTSVSGLRRYQRTA